jgi:hypothetical protein
MMGTARQETDGGVATYAAQHLWTARCNFDPDIETCVGVKPCHC